MLTPAEELGLRGLALASRVRKAVYGISEPDLTRMIGRISEEAFRRHLIYLREGQQEVVHVMACPLTVLPDQLAYIHFVTLTVQNALKRLLEIYLQDAAVRDVLRLPDEEEQWLRDCWGP